MKIGADALEGCPAEAKAFLQETGLPLSVITIFQADAEPARTSVTIGGRTVDGLVLGHSREEDPLFLDYADGAVWLLASWRPAAPIPVNAGVTAFVESLALVASAYPFYPADADLDDAGSAEDRLRESLETIDVVSTADPDGFWSAFLNDVGVGDYGDDGDDR
ncbi:SUKH-4 family immunity protein [Actinoplanes sp. M2I2]|uniref:SUKH-4 family immunity protein n=1 Tax=Actinoplanes sp. M2I2 TaxID=1734444 RepID=UPI002020A55E|nr:SUKH-4 family immunity protein [Actinoplanes sp. M2I2]